MQILIHDDANKTCLSWHNERCFRKSLKTMMITCRQEIVVHVIIDDILEEQHPHCQGATPHCQWTTPKLAS
jgi:hypothetical protein